MFEDIYKKTDVISNNPMDYSVTISEERWEEIKKDPKELGDTMKFVINGIGDAISKDHRLLFTGFQFSGEPKRLNFDFKLYDLSDKDQRKTYLDSLDPEEREWYEL